MPVWSLVVATVSDWYDDRAQRLGAALAYYTVFALAPGVVLVVAVAGLGLGPDRAQAQIVQQIGYLTGEEGARAIAAVIANARQQSAGTTATILATATLVFGLWGVFGELKDGLNTVWGVTSKPSRRLVEVIMDRFASFAMVTGIGFLLLVSLALSAWLAALGTYFSDLLPAPRLVLKALDVSLSFVIITVLFALIFKLLPDVSIAWRDVWLGAAVTSVLFTAGKSLIGLYLGKSSVGSVYGAAGSLVIILMWVYYSSQIVILGAEFTKVWVRRRGSGFTPREGVVPLTEEARAEQGIARPRAQA
jgi:membrane protein